MVVDLNSTITFAGLVQAVIAMVVGFVGHELIHIGVLSAFGRRPRIEIGFERLAFAAIPPSDTPRWQNAIALLAPIPWAFAGLYAAFVLSQPPLLTLPLSLDGLLFLVGFAVAALPSPADFYVLLLYRPENAAPEVVADG